MTKVSFAQQMLDHWAAVHAHHQEMMAAAREHYRQVLKARFLEIQGGDTLSPLLDALADASVEEEFCIRGRNSNVRCTTKAAQGEEYCEEHLAEISAAGRTLR